MRTEDGKIVQECLNGKPQAFGMLVDKYREGVYAFAYAELRDFQDAQDVTQEVFLQAYRKLSSLRNQDPQALTLLKSLLIQLLIIGIPSAVESNELWASLNA